MMLGDQPRRRADPSPSVASSDPGREGASGGRGNQAQGPELVGVGGCGSPIGTVSMAVLLVPAVAGVGELPVGSCRLHGLVPFSLLAMGWAVGQGWVRASWCGETPPVTRNGYGRAGLGIGCGPIHPAALFASPSPRLRLRGFTSGRGLLSGSLHRQMESRWTLEHVRWPALPGNLAAPRPSGTYEASGTGPFRPALRPVLGSCKARSICARGPRSRGGSGLPGIRGAKLRPTPSLSERG